jgi:tetratricopeptide (TPR) repeat protein
MLAVALFSIHLFAAAPDPMATSTAGRPTIAVIPFATLSSAEYGAIGQGAVLALSAMLAENKEVNLISATEVSQALRKRDLTADSISRGAAAASFARALGADWLITGTYQATWPNLQITLRLVDGKDGKVRAETWELGKIEHALAMFDDLAARAFPEVGLAKPRANAIGTTNVYAWREASLAAEILAGQPYTARPRSHLPAGAVRKARIHCEEAVRLDPKWTTAHACLALSIVLHGIAVRDTKEATLALESAGRAGQVPLGAYAAYLAHLELNAEKEALAALETSAAKYPAMLALPATLGEHQQLRGAHGEAKKVYERMLQRSPNNTVIMARLGKALVALNEGEKGLAMTKSALALSGDDPQIMVELGSRYIDLQRLGDAEAALKKAMELDKRDGRAYLRLGYVYLLQKKPVEAIAVLERSIAESDLEDEWRARALAHFDLARAHGQSGAVDKAFQALDAAIENGFRERSKIEGEADLALLTKDPRWPGLLEKLKR